jgi:hypothetical protein
MSLSGAGSLSSSKIIFLYSVSVKKMNAIFRISIGDGVCYRKNNFIGLTTKGKFPPLQGITGKVLPPSNRRVKKYITIHNY